MQNNATFKADNADGIDISSSRNVHIRDAILDVGDDAVDIRAGSGWAGQTQSAPRQVGGRCSTQNIMVEDLIYRNGHGLRVDESGLGGVRNVTFLNVVVDGNGPAQNATLNGRPHVVRFTVRPNRGGVWEDVTWQNISGDNCNDGLSLLQNHSPDSGGYPLPLPPQHAAELTSAPPIWRRITVRDVKLTTVGQTAAGGFVTLEDAPIEELVLDRVELSYKTGHTPGWKCAAMAGSGAPTTDLLRDYLFVTNGTADRVEPSLVGKDYNCTFVSKRPSPQGDDAGCSAIATQPVDTWSANSSDTAVRVMTFKVGDGHSVCYEVSVGQEPWLVGSGVELFAGGSWHNSSKGGLKLENTSDTTGEDGLGSFSAVALHWRTKSGTPFTTSVRVYHSTSSVVFRQDFPEGVARYLGTTSETHTQQQWGSPGTGFPVFDATGAHGKLGGSDGLGFAAFEETAGHPVVGRFPENFREAKKSSPDGVPLAFFDETARTAVLSPLTSMLATVYDNSEGALRCGVQGSALSLPAGYQTESILHVGSKSDGVNGAFLSWGDLLRQRYNKPAPSFTRHAQLERLGYSSIGHYFYGIEKNKTAADTFLAMSDYAKRVGLPYSYYLIDSFWYREGPTPNGFGGSDSGFGGTWRWDDVIARSPHMFPEGLQDLSTRLGAPLVMHMGKWTGNKPDTQRGAQWAQPPPYVETGPGEWVVEGGGSLPLGSEFWDELWANMSAWGLQTFKLDHVEQQIPEMNFTNRDVMAVENWLTDMTDSAWRHGIYKEYGGHYSNGVLHSVTLQGATSARVSDDYIPGVKRPKGSCETLLPAEQQQRVTPRGNVLLSSNTLYPWSVGLLPYRDAFFSGTQSWGTCTCLQGNTGPESAATSLKPEWWGLQEGIPELQALVAALTAGPIAPGDGIGDTDVDLVMRTCRKDGILLKPSRPIFPIDSWWTGNALGSSGPSPRGSQLNLDHGAAEVGYTFEEINGLRWYFVLGVGLEKAFDLTPGDVHWAPAGNSTQWQWSWDCAARGCTRPSSDPADVLLEPFGADRPIRLPPFVDGAHGAMSWARLRFTRTAPTLCNGWLLLGEAEKFISVSRSRILDLAVDCGEGGGLVVQVGGAPGETVTMLLRPPRGAVVARSCTAGPGGKCSIAAGA